MPLAYYSRTAASDFWTEHWGTHSKRALRRALYSPPILRLLGHMILTVAVKPRVS